MDEDDREADELRAAALDRLLDDPMFAAALEAHGLRRGALPWEQEENSSLEAVRREGGNGRPALIVDWTGEGNLWWHSLGGHSFSYDVGRDGRTLTIGDIDLPSTVLSALSGRTLDAVAALPGARELTIIDATATPVISKDRTGARMTLEHGGNR